LLQQGDITLELHIFERGTPPEFRAWIEQNGVPVDDAELSVTLTRLGGRTDHFDFSRDGAGFWRGDGEVVEPHSFDVEAVLTLDGKQYRWRWESHEGRVKIDRTLAERAGIETAVAGPGSIERHLQVYGRLATPPDQRAHIRARFPGIVTDVRVNVGDRVAAGDVLAIIESNKSLQHYQLRAPIDGVVQRRSVNVGEITGDAPLFTLLNDETLWAQLKIFPGQRGQVKPGLSVHIQHNSHEHDGEIASLTPSTDGSPFVLARVVLNNDRDDMAPGDMVRGQIDVEKVEVPLVVDNRALQGFRDWTVVFIRVGDTYEIRPLALGRSDGRHTEVLAGLDPGDRYVVENSYLIKADIEKSGASHDH